MTTNCIPTFLSSTSSLTTKPNELSVTCWNILLPYLATEEDYPKSNKNHLDWYKFRLPKICKIIKNIDSDIFCLQECHLTDFIKDFEPYLKSINYNICLNNGKKVYKKYNMTIAILYKSNKLNLIYKDLRSRGMILLFNLKNNKNQYIIVCNFHLAGNPIEHKARLTQTVKLLRRIEALFMNHKKLGVTKDNSFILFCGDFNTTKNECVFQFLNNGFLSKDFKNKNHPDIVSTQKDITHKYNFKEAYEIGFKYNTNIMEHPSYIGNIFDTGRLIDFIFYGQNEKNKIYKLKHCLKLFQHKKNYLDEENKLKGFPNEEIPSDHVPIGVVFEQIGNNTTKSNKETSNKVTIKSKKNHQEINSNWTEFSSF